MFGFFSDYSIDFLIPVIGHARYNLVESLFFLLIYNIFYSLFALLALQKLFQN